jgi:hypothetical protein
MAKIGLWVMGAALAFAALAMPLYAQDGGGDSRDARPEVTPQQALEEALSRLQEGTAFTAEQLAQMVQSIEGMRKLPANGLRMVEVGDGRVALSSLNGRFLIVGDVYDAWNQRKLTSLEDADKYANRVDIDKIGLDLNMLATLPLRGQPPAGDGDGEYRQTILFVDPGHERSRAMIEQARSYLSESGQGEAIKVVLVPFLDGSDRLARRTMCLAEREGGGAALKAVMAQTINEIEPQSEQCGTEKVLKSYSVAQVLGVTSAPYWIMPNGEMKEGQIDLSDALSSEEKS